ncbi:MAG: glycosyltransferase family 2 protein, partial [Oscillospiraceae bacterium]|nr:glycosyltransferase family 2 protein [Oscillospiraceae bacterium]
MVTVSLCMIVKNEEDVLARCLDSVKDAVDEIIIVDTGSIDKTKTIARQYTKKVFDFKWCDNFSAARNFSYSKATKDYQLWLDADDVVPPESLEQLKRLKTALDPEIEIVTMKYITHFDDKDNPILTSVRERLTKMSKNYQWIDPVHECIPLIGKQLISDITIHHRKIHKDKTADRNLHIYQALEKSGEPLSPRQQYYFARELKDHGELQKAIYYFEKFLDSKQGWVEDN